MKLDSDARTIMWNNLKKELRSEDLVSIMEGVRKLWDADQKQIVNKEEMDTKKKRLNHASDLVKDFGKEVRIDHTYRSFSNSSSGPEGIRSIW